MIIMDIVVEKISSYKECECHGSYNCECNDLYTGDGELVKAKIARVRP
jgi:hypothetical protein